MRRILKSIILVVITVRSSALGASDVPALCKAEMNQGAMRSDIAHREINIGTFLGLKIGDSKTIVVGKLVEIGVRDLFPTLDEEIIASNADDLGKLSKEDGLVLEPRAEAVIKFNGDRVAHVTVRQNSLWREPLQSAKFRKEVFVVLSNALKSETGVFVRNYASDTRQVRITAIDSSGRQLLRKYDSWEFNRDGPDGYWHLQLRFKSDLLLQIVTDHTQCEVP